MIRVAVPVYNAEEWITGCLLSILAQSVPDFTCVVVDDGSTDATGRMLARLGGVDDRLTVLRRATNAGALQNLLTAFAAQPCQEIGRAHV